MIRYYVVILMTILCYVPLKAQVACDLSVRLIVTEMHNNEPLPDIMLYISDAKINVQTDENGIAAIEHLCPGKYSVHIHSVEIQDTTIDVSIDKSASYRLVVNHAAAQILNMVVVRDKNEKTILQSKDELDKAMLRSNSGKTIGEQLKSINGVSTLNNGATISKPVIHGLHSNRILVLNNGVRQEDQQWGSEHALNIDPFIANQITVLKGAAGVRYGTDAIGGVVLVEPSPLGRDIGWSGDINLAAFSNNRMGVISGMLEHRFNKVPELAFRLQGTLKQGGNYRIPGGYWVANTGVKEQDFAATLSYQKVHSGVELFFSRFSNTLGIYRGSHTGSQQDLFNAINSDKPLVSSGFSYTIERPRQEVNHHLLKLKTYLDNKSGLWTLIYAYQNNFRQEYDVMRIDNGKPQLNLTLNTQSLNLNLDHKKIRNFSGQMGIDLQYQHNTFKDGDRVFIPSYYAYTAALYGIERYTKNNWTLEGGMRFDYKHFDMYNPEGQQYKNIRYLFDYRNPSVTLAVKNRVNQKLSWIATLANAWRAPQAPELFSAGFHQGGARIELGNKDLRPEKSYSLNLSGLYEIDKKIRIEASLYGQSIRDFIYLKPGQDVLTIRGYYKTFNYIQTDALMTGADISLKYDWSKNWTSDVRISMLRAKDITQKDWLILMPSDRGTLGLKYHFDVNRQLKDGYISINGQYVMQQNRIPSNFDSIDYPRPPMAYYLLNAEAGVNVKIHQQALFFSISANNLLNAKYRDYMDIFRYFIDQPGTNISLRASIYLN
ncbi:MAG: TonB-dependent receptor plug domain-containing protein [Bacteroidota bacterium]